MMNILIPMAGLGTTFTDTEETTPKAFEDVDGKPMFVRVMEDFSYPDARFILIVREEQILSRIDLIEEVESKYNAKFITIEKITEGTVCSALFAREDVNTDVPLLISMADQVVDFNLGKFLNDCSKKKLDGNIVCIHKKEADPRLSYAAVNNLGLVSLVKEKEVISNLATAGIYYFSKGKYFVNAAIDMIINNDRVNNEFYVAPVYNYMISKNLKVGTYNIEEKQLFDLGTKKKLERYLQQIGSIKRAC